MPINLRIRASQAPGIFVGNQAPSWQSIINEALVPGVPYNRHCSTLCTDPDGDPITFSESLTQDPPPVGYVQGRPPGISFAAGQFSGTPTGPDADYAYCVDADDAASIPNEEADYLARSTANGVTAAWNFAQFSTRLQLMQYLQSIEPQCPNNGPRYTCTGIDFSAPERYFDPVPAGSQEKMFFNTNLFLTGGKSLALIFRAGEAGSDNGPLIEIPVSAASPVTYAQMIWRPVGPILTHDYNTGDRGRKILFLNDLNFTNGQLVGVLNHDDGPWVSAYIVTSSASVERYFFSSSPYGSNWQLYGAINTGGPESTQAEWDARYGPSRDSRNPANTAFAFVNRPQLGQWYVTTYMMDQSWSGSISNGLYKQWGNPYGSPSQLQGLCFRDAALDPFSGARTNSIRPCYRPEMAGSITFPSGVDHGILVDHIIVSSQPIKVPGGFDLQYPGQIIPPFQPTIGSVDRG